MYLCGYVFMYTTYMCIMVFCDHTFYLPRHVSIKLCRHIIQYIGILLLCICCIMVPNAYIDFLWPGEVGNTKPCISSVSAWPYPLGHERVWGPRAVFVLWGPNNTMNIGYWILLYIIPLKCLILLKYYHFIKIIDVKKINYTTWIALKNI